MGPDIFTRITAYFHAILRLAVLSPVVIRNEQLWGSMMLQTTNHDMPILLLRKHWHIAKKNRTGSDVQRYGHGCVHPNSFDR